MEADAKAPIFKPIRSRFMIAGLSAGAALATLAVFGIGAALSVVLGSWTHVADIPLTDGERAQALTEYRTVAAQIDSIEKQRKVDGADDFESMQLSGVQQQSVELAREWGIRPGMGRAELEALVPETRQAEVENMPFLLRIIAFVLVPTGGMYIMLAEINRTSLVKEVSRARRFARSQKDYHCAPREHLARMARR